MDTQQSHGPSLIRRIAIDYSAALIVVIATILCGVGIGKMLNLEIKFYPIPLWGLWWLFLLEIFNLCRILYEENRNRSGVPLVRTKTLVFLFYPILSGCWILSPWVIFQHNKIAANLAITAYDHYWGKGHDIDRAFDSAMILYFCTREPTFLHAVPDGVLNGNPETQAKAADWFVRVLSRKMPIERVRMPAVEHFMILPFKAATAERSRDEAVHRRIISIYRTISSATATELLQEGVTRAGFYRKIRETAARAEAVPVATETVPSLIR